MHTNVPLSVMSKCEILRPPSVSNCLINWYKSFVKISVLQFVKLHITNVIISGKLNTFVRLVLISSLFKYRSSNFLKSQTFLKANLE